MNLEPSQILIPALILSHLIVAVACTFIGFAVGTRRSMGHYPRSSSRRRKAIKTMRQRDKATDEISKKLGVTKRHAIRIRNKLAVESKTDEELIALLSPIEREKLRKLTVERELKQEQLAILKRQHVSHDEMLGAGIKLGSMLSEFAGSCIGNWPSDFAGCTEIQIREKATKYWDSFLAEFRTTAKRI